MARFGQRYDIQAELSVPEALEDSGINPAVETQLLRIVQEALSNIRKHARAKTCRVAFAISEPLLEVTITDDGCGFDIEAAATHGEGYGLRSMRERTEAVGGSLRVTSQPGKGTTVNVSMPVEELMRDGRIA
jgi:two-component system sensor histidine kinase DegS